MPRSPPPPPAAAPAEAPRCGAHDAVTGHLAGRYGESRRAIGLAGDQAMMEIHAAEETGSRTILVTLPDGRACLLASGSDFEAMDGAAADEVRARGGARPRLRF